MVSQPAGHNALLQRLFLRLQTISGECAISGHALETCDERPSHALPLGKHLEVMINGDASALAIG